MRALLRFRLIFVFLCFISMLAACKRQPIPEHHHTVRHIVRDKKSHLPYYLRSVELYLHKKLYGIGTQIREQNGAIHLLFPPSTNFQPNSSTVNANLMVVLDQVAIVAKRLPDFAIIAEGYTDDQAQANVNQALSERRAHATMAYLESQGVNAARMNAVGCGEHNPVANNNSKQGKMLNRRVELTIHMLSLPHFARQRLYPFAKNSVTFETLKDDALAGGDQKG